MRDTVYCDIPADSDEDAITSSIQAVIDEVQTYVPGYRLRAEPQFDPGRVSVFIEVEGAGDFLPTYSGNLDIMTAAAVRVGEGLATVRADKVKERQ